MKTAEVTATPPAQLVADVRRLKAYFPYRICWGAFKPDAPADTLSGADHTRRNLNTALRNGYAAFTL